MRASRTKMKSKKAKLLHKLIAFYPKKDEERKVYYEMVK